MRDNERLRRLPVVAIILLTVLTITGSGPAIWAASHREAPLIALDPAADNTDVYAFVSYDAANLARSPDARKITFIMNVNPGQDPGDGPNYFNFDDEVLYAINIDNDADGKAEDVVYEFRFKSADRPGPGGLTSPVPYLGNPHIPAGVGLPGITALDGPGSEGLTRRQTYTVTEVRGRHRVELFSGRTLVAPPAHAGPRTDAKLSGPGREGHIPRRSDGHPCVRGAARGDVLYRPGRRLRHSQSAPLPAAVDRPGGGHRHGQSLRREPLQRL